MAILPSEDIWKYLQKFWFQLRGGHYWHLVGRGQDCCETFCSAQEDICPQMSEVPGKMPCLLYGDEAAGLILLSKYM